MFTETELPVMCGLPKDHKPGREMRALVNGNLGPTSGLSNTLSDILNPFVDELRENIEGTNTC